MFTKNICRLLDTRESAPPPRATAAAVLRIANSEKLRCKIDFEDPILKRRLYRDALYGI